MRRSTKAAFVFAILIAAFTVVFLAPVVPVSRTWYTGTTQPDTFPMMPCSAPSNAVNPTLVYQGFESITHYFAGVGIITYTRCYMPIPSDSPSFMTTMTNSLGTVISVSGVSLCASDCIYPAPYATALVQFNSNSPVSTLKVYVNGTYDATPLQNPNNMTHYAYLWKGSVPNSLIPVVKGDTYVFEFSVVYQDGSTGSAYAQIVAN